MPRPPNAVKTIQITVSTNDRIVSLIDELVASGLYGKNRAETVERLMTQQISVAVEQVRKLRVKDEKA